MKEDRGSTAVEFSMVGIPFILMIVGTIEMALMFTSQSLLQEAAFNASRMIRTGQLQQGGGSQETIFRESVCNFTSLLIPCDQIRMQVQQVPSFADADDMPPQYDSNGNLISTGFDPGGVNDVVLIRLSYNYPVKTPLMQPVLSNVSGGKRSMLATVVLQAEPYEFVDDFGG